MHERYMHVKFYDERKYHQSSQSTSCIISSITWCVNVLFYRVMREWHSRNASFCCLTLARWLDYNRKFILLQKSQKSTWCRSKGISSKSRYARWALSNRPYLLADLVVDHPAPQTRTGKELLNVKRFLLRNAPETKRRIRGFCTIVWSVLVGISWTNCKKNWKEQFRNLRWNQKHQERPSWRKGRHTFKKHHKVSKKRIIRIR